MTAGCGGDDEPHLVDEGKPVGFDEHGSFNDDRAREPAGPLGRDATLDLLEDQRMDDRIELLQRFGIGKDGRAESLCDQSSRQARVSLAQMPRRRAATPRCAAGTPHGPPCRHE